MPHEPYRNLVPAPRSVTPAPQPGPQGRQSGDGPEFVLGPHTALDAGPGTHGTADWLRAVLTPATGLTLPPPHADRHARGAPGERRAERTGEGGDGEGGDGGVVVLRTDEAVAARLGPEGYELRAEPGTLRISGGGAAGVFWGAQTLRQLLGPDAYRRARTTARQCRRIPAVRIEDAPRFGWRGHLLDVARHFMPKDGVLRTVDLLAAHKLNVLHLHLTDDQGWRMEIRRRPRLTEVGAVRARSRLGHPPAGAGPLWDERAHGGCYSQDDLREIVAYAAERHVTVVPEIDVPGHSQAAIAAYPELGNTDVVDTAALEVWTEWGVSPNVLAPAEHVLRFYEEVLEEVLEVFPSRFVHLGGDECPKDQWRESPAAQARIRELGLDGEEALQAWFTGHFARWLAARGRRLIGWDEILEGGSEGGSEGGLEGGSGGLAKGAAVSSWRGRAGGVAAALAGHDVVMCPEERVYLDHRQDGGEDEPVPLGYLRTLRDVYEFEPVPPELAGTPHERHVLGAQANMWTECTESQQRVDYQTFPRLAAFAEAVWSRARTRPEVASADGDFVGRNVADSDLADGDLAAGDLADGDAPDGDFADFERRMTDAHYARLDAMGVDYRPPGGPRPWQRRPGIPGRPRSGPEGEPGPGERPAREGRVGGSA